MKFIDETRIIVEAGKGGNGCLSFRREKYVPRGGPDGGDGGDGGSVYIIANKALTTLVDFRFKRKFTAHSGKMGEGKNKRGLSADDLYIQVPIGTQIKDTDTGEAVTDLTENGQKILLAQGGFHGLGNARFKSSVNRAPRQTSPGSEGQLRNLHLELKLLADVGLVGLPNAGKSTLISVVSNARPKVADYPFTTLVPNLGVIQIDAITSFVMADIPGLIPGASTGAGLGIRFLKHIMRTKLLLHLVDCHEENAANDFLLIEKELQQFDEKLQQKERWLVITKLDLIAPDIQQEVTTNLVNKIGWTGKIFTISSANRKGLDELTKEIAESIYNQAML